MMEIIFVYMFGAFTALDVIGLISAAINGDVFNICWYSFLVALMISCSIFAIKDVIKSRKLLLVLVEKVDA